MAITTVFAVNDTDYIAKLNTMISELNAAMASAIAAQAFGLLYGAVTLNGIDGVTITHNKGNTNYVLKVLPTGANAQDMGDISYVKAANTVVVYNTGRPRLAADFELTASG